MTYNQNLFTSRSIKPNRKAKDFAKNTVDMYKVAMNLVLEKTEFDVSCPQVTASFIVAKHFMKKGQLSKAEELLSKHKAAAN